MIFYFGWNNVFCRKHSKAKNLKKSRKILVFWLPNFMQTICGCANWDYMSTPTKGFKLIQGTPPFWSYFTGLSREGLFFFTSKTDEHSAWEWALRTNKFKYKYMLEISFQWPYPWIVQHKCVWRLNTFSIRQTASNQGNRHSMVHQKPYKLDRLHWYNPWRGRPSGRVGAPRAVMYDDGGWLE